MVTFTKRWDETNTPTTVTIQHKDDPFVQGKMAYGQRDEQIQTYSTADSNRCSGAWMDASKMCICPGAAFGIPHVTFTIDDTKMNLCANCVFDTPSIAKKYGENEGRRALPKTCKYIPPNYVPPNSNQQHVPAGLCNPRGDLGLYQELHDLGLYVARTEAFDTPTLNDTIHSANVHNAFTQQLQSRPVKLSPLGRGFTVTWPVLKESGKEFADFVEQWQKGLVYKLQDKTESYLPMMTELFYSYYEKDKRNQQLFIENVAKELIKHGLFDWHRDAGIAGTSENRMVTSIFDSEKKKTMYFTDRKTGRWFSFETPHGTVVNLSRQASGCSEGRYQHKVENAEGTYAFVIQYKMTKADSVEDTDLIPEADTMNDRGVEWTQ